jgi:hypothetical protein
MDSEPFGISKVDPEPKRASWHIHSGSTAIVVVTKAAFLIESPKPTIYCSMAKVVYVY